ncbi:hypothetical protein SDRG_06576 [Saprolegnia diclina VS20]|uniref:Uncharacterized protein n=1 Tax=Saprolegnia diclina (strain VS20) TaxID=1156394 RepID=T0RZI8_SAPDV|nr:hypothetical protein SDRG_06576 [Saprolegnia diclina VS20]EQC35822.1 hypothetical protein SDRG_06576 [Saprolegnia diclina VS20]|eukprot:XP_008610584.1 hypothetical protein SDRG_06576 [Saprolegnia diclina VS20]
MALPRLVEEIEIISASLGRHEFHPMEQQKPIYVTELNAPKPDRAAEARRKTGDEFWAEFRDTAAALGDLDEITHYSTTFESLEKKCKALQVQMAGMSKQLHTRKSDLYLDSRINERQEQKEQEWEGQMQAGRAELEHLETKLAKVQEDIESLETDIRDGEARAAIDPSLLMDENETLEEILLLRAEEKKDLLAALAALKRQRDEHVLESEKVQTSQSAELERLKLERDSLKKTILAYEEPMADDASMDRPTVEARAAALADALGQWQTKLEIETASVTALKAQMQRLVETQAANGTPGTPHHTCAVVLQLLYANNGEMSKTQLQAEAAATGCDDAHVVRAIYALVGKSLVHIDRSLAEGIVTSMLL